MPRTLFSRRTLLQALGLAGSGWASHHLLPHLSLRRSAQAAGSPNNPTRLAFLFSQHGVIPEEFYFRTSGNMPSDRDWEFSLEGLSENEFSKSLRPLYRHRRKMTLIEGMSHYLALDDTLSDDHGRGTLTAITGSRGDFGLDSNRSFSKGPSIDDIVARDLRQKDASLTDLTRLSLSTSSWPLNHHQPFYSVDTQNKLVMTPSQGDPVKAFESLFGNFAGGDAPDPIAENQSKVLDLASAEYQELAAQLGSEDRQRLEAHRAMISDLQDRLTRAPSNGCEKPASPNGLSGDEVQRLEQSVDAFFRLSTTAFSCDLSRVVTFYIATLPAKIVGGNGDFHNDYAHNSMSSSEAKRGMLQADFLHASWLAQWADLLDAVPNGEGGTLLDSTALVWTGELSEGYTHGHHPVPIVILGGANGAFRTGRYLHVAQNLRYPASAPSYTDNRRVGLPHNHLLVSLAQAMGVNTDRVGEASVMSKDGALDLRGRFERLHSS
jgi:hypothetical protein